MKFLVVLVCTLCLLVTGCSDASSLTGDQSEVNSKNESSGIPESGEIALLNGGDIIESRELSKSEIVFLFGLAKPENELVYEPEAAKPQHRFQITIGDEIYISHGFALYKHSIGLVLKDGKAHAFGLKRRLIEVIDGKLVVHTKG
ncbi:MAG: hypothetical protein KDB07_03455 [Planctomycetes bacterium]|nr:hypothetical protein [Planctomycetota bacterium]